MLQHEDKLIKTIEDFRRFARYVSGRFKVEIVFEAASAKANSNNVIYLPMMSNMTERDIQFQYGILLHELGHIKYSDYTGIYDNLITTENHFFLCNAIEDARIENLLMFEYDGAIDYFSTLYFDFAHDAAYMEKVFGFKPTDTDFFYHLRIYVHDFLVNLKQKNSLESLYGKKNAIRLNEFLQKYKINDILKSRKVNTWNDVVQLSIPIYEASLKFIKDKSSKLNIDEVEKSKNIVEKELTILKENLLELQDQISKAKDITNSLKNEVNATRKERNKFLKSVSEERSDLRHKLENDYARLRSHSKQMMKKEKAMTSLSIKNNYIAKKEALESKLKDIRNQAQNIKNAKNLPKELKKIANKEKALLNKIGTKNKQIQAADNRYKSKLSEIDSHNSSLSTDQYNKINDRVASNGGQLNSINNKVSEKSIITDAENKYNLAKDTIKKNSDIMQKDVINCLKKAQKSLDKHNLEMPSMPSFKKSEEWPDSDQEQQNFDNDAANSTGEIVNNGVSFDIGSDRQIMSFIDQSIEDVQDFNVLEHFVDLLEDNKLDNFNEVANTIDDAKKTETFETSVKHLTATDKYDKVDIKTNASSEELFKIRKDNSQVLKNLKNIFRNKLKFSKRDHFKGNREEGNLDSRSLWKLASRSIDDKNYFEVNDPKYVNKVAATIVADVSGSQEKEYTAYGKKIKELMLFLSDALTEVFVKHEALGIHAPICSEMQDLKANANIFNRRVNNLETIVYKRFDDKKNNGINNVQIECTDNSDGESLRIAAKRLLKCPARSRILFYITDGKPYLSDCNMDIIDQDLVKTIAWLKENKIRVFAFGFNEDGKKFFKENFCHIKTWNDLLNFAQKAL
jgi:hypothetical protein